MLAYSSIAQAGFLSGIVSNTQAGYEALVFYGLVYAMMNLEPSSWYNY